MYNDQKKATDRVGKKLEVKSESVESFDDKHFNFVEREETFEDPYLEVERENMRAVENSNRE